MPRHPSFPARWLEPPPFPPPSVRSRIRSLSSGRRWTCRRPVRARCTRCWRPWKRRPSVVRWLDPPPGGAGDPARHLPPSPGVTPSPPPRGSRSTLRIGLAGFCCSLGALLLRPLPGAAQAAVSPQLVTCESIRKQRRECVVPPDATVRLVRRLGPSPCEAGRGWGREGATIWVDRGCRAEFSVTPAAARSIVTCGRAEPGRHACPTVAEAEVVLVRQLGDAACVRGRTWGYEAGTIWTEGGCRADFEVAPRAQPVLAEPLHLLCESVDGRRAECPVPGAGRVVLIRQLSRSPCARGRSWNAAGGRIWVDAGCRAEFEVRSR